MAELKLNVGLDFKKAKQDMKTFFRDSAKTSAPTEKAGGTGSQGGGLSNGKVIGLLGLIAAGLQGLQPIVDFIKLGTSFIVLVIAKAIKLIGEVIPSIKDTLVNFYNKGVELWTKLWDNISKVWEWLKTIWEGIKAFFSDPVGNFKKALLDLWNILKEKLPFLQKVETAVNSVKEGIKVLWDGIRTFFNDPIGTIKQAFAEVWAFLKEKLPFLEKVEGWVKSAVDYLSKLWEDTKTWFNDLIKGILDLPKKIWDYMKELPGLLASKISSTIKNILPDWMSSKPKKADDFVVTSSGQVIQTNPNDTIYATKNTGISGGGSKVFNFYGVTPQEMVDVIKRELVNDLSMYGRF